MNLSPTTHAHYDVDEIKRRYPLADVVAASGIRLRRAGDRFWALCPFHDERRPSFMVASDRFHCFGGCPHQQRDGDVITFVMRREGLTFVEACAHLTGRAVPARAAAAELPTSAINRQRRWDHLTLEEQLVLNATLTLYRAAFWRTPPARAYLRQRGIPEWVARQCGIGYADGHSLEAYLRKHTGVRVAETLGLLRPPEAHEHGRPLREFFAGRIVVPELRGGQPIWLIGRPLADQATRVKYLALPGEKPVLGLERASRRHEVFLVEGVFDWLTAVSWGLAACCACGTDLPPDRLGWLARARTVFGVLDADQAGRAGAERFGQMLGSRWRPIALPEGCDLNDLGQRPDGRKEFFALVADARRTRRESTNNAPGQFSAMSTAPDTERRSSNRGQ